MGLQVEDGHTRINNEVLEKLVSAHLLGSELALLLFVIRKTWGFHKKEDVISLTQFEGGLQLSRPTVVKTLNNLEKKKMLVKVRLLDSYKIAYRFNKYWPEWVVNAPLLVKSTHEFGKPALTKTSKPALTHKRKKENKRVINEKTEAIKAELRKRFGIRRTVV